MRFYSHIQKTWPAIVACACLIGWPTTSNAVLVYRQTFDDANGTPEITPGDGILGIDPAGGNGDATFDATGGLFGGVLNLSSGTNIDTAAMAGTTAPAVGGSNITGLGTL